MAVEDIVRNIQGSSETLGSLDFRVASERAEVLDRAAILDIINEALGKIAAVTAAATETRDTLARYEEVTEQVKTTVYSTISKVGEGEGAHLRTEARGNTGATWAIAEMYHGYFNKGTLALARLQGALHGAATAFERDYPITGSGLTRASEAATNHQQSAVQAMASYVTFLTYK